MWQFMVKQKEPLQSYFEFIKNARQFQLAELARFATILQSGTGTLTEIQLQEIMKAVTK